MLVLAIATSIDALAVGITLAFLKVNIWAAAAFIGAVTFIISAAGVKIGHAFGEKYTNKAELAGGIILMAIGVKILLEHLGVISFKKHPQRAKAPCGCFRYINRRDSSLRPLFDAEYNKSFC